MKTTTIVKLAIIAGLLLVGFGIYGWSNSLRSEGIRYEYSLSAQYESNQNELSAYISSFYEQLGIANKKTAALDSVLTHAVQGRYGENGFSANGAFFAAVKEAYPDLSTNLNLYDKILDHVKSGREAFKGKQDLLIDKARVYKVWVNDGIIRQAVVHQILGFPTHNLEARVGGKVVARGQDALDKIQEIIMTNSTADAFQTGRQEPLNVP